MPASHTRIFETLETFQQDVAGALFAYVAYDAAHRENPCPMYRLKPDQALFKQRKPGGASLASPTRRAAGRAC
jgi:hypothetical protein